MLTVYCPAIAVYCLYSDDIHFFISLCKFRANFFMHFSNIILYAEQCFIVTF